MEPGMGGTGFGGCEKWEESMVERGVLPQMFQGYEDLQLLNHRHRLARASKLFNEMGSH
jgi:hypothetical protein